MSKTYLDGVVEYNGVSYKVYQDHNTGLTKLQSIPAYLAEQAKERVKKMQAQSQQQQGQPPQQGQGAGKGGGNNNIGIASDDKERPPLDSAFKARLSSIMTDNKANRNLNRQVRGKLDMRGLHRVGTGQANVFKQALDYQGKDYSVMLAIDTSGSMSGGRLETAIRAALYLGVHFEAIGIEYGVTGFGNGVDTYKKLSEALDVNKIKAIACGGGTPMLAGIKLALAELKPAKGKQLMIVISDGEADARERNPINQLIQANPQIDIFGIGIGVKFDLIPDNQMIKELDQLKPAILGWLGRKIRRGV